MRILISNDDGIAAPGILRLIHAVRDLGDVTVVAPDRQRSASSHGISLNRALYAKPVDLGLPGVAAFSLSGTPVDCVKWAITELGRSDPFDWMLSGINEGANLASDVLYSGTVAAAGEAALQHVPAIAFSLCGPPFDFSAAATVARGVFEALRPVGFPPDSFVNVNFPAFDLNTAPWRVTELGVRSYRDEFVQDVDEEGSRCYRYAGEAVEETGSDSSDVRVVRRGQVSITPLMYHFTNHAMIDTLRLQLPVQSENE